MKFLVSGFLVFFTSLVSFAKKNPQIRVCHEYGAEFAVANIPGDQIGLCKTGSSYVGAIDMIYFKWEQKTPQSVQNYMNGNTTCPNLEVNSLPFADEDVQKFCLFEDGSVMDSISLQLGRNHPANQPLNQFLGLSF